VKRQWRWSNAWLARPLTVAVLDMHDPAVATTAKGYGVTRVPAVVVDGQLAGCCTGTGPDEPSLKAAGIGTPLP